MNADIEQKLEDMFYKEESILNKLCSEDKYNIKNRELLISSLLLLFVRAKEVLLSKVEHFMDVISMCEALLAIKTKRDQAFSFSISVGSRIADFNINGLVPGLIEDCLNDALLNECTMFYNTNPDSMDYVDNFFMDEHNELYQLYKAHTEIDYQAELNKRGITDIEEDLLKHLKTSIAIFESVGMKEAGSKLLDEDTKRVYAKLSNEEIRLIKSTYERFLEIETKAQGKTIERKWQTKETIGNKTNDAKLGRLSMKIMEKLPEDMEHKHLFIAEFLMASGALTYKGEPWIDFFSNKSDNEKEHQVKHWMSRYESFKQNNIEL